MNAGTIAPNLGTAAAKTADTDGTLAANSDANIATQKATKTYVDNHAGGTSGYVVKTVNYNAVAGDRIAADTTGGSFTITLPPTPINGADIVVVDLTNSWVTNNLTIARNGNQINGSSADLVLGGSSINGYIELLFSSSAKWITLPNTLFYGSHAWISFNGNAWHLIDASGVASVLWNERYLYDSAANISIDWQDRELFGPNGTTIVLSFASNTSASFFGGALIINSDGSLSGSGGFVAMKDDTGWVANADAGDKTAVIPSQATISSVAGALEVLVPGSGSIFTSVASKCKALETALNANLLPNA